MGGEVVKRKEKKSRMKRIALLVLIIALIAVDACAGRKEQTPWWGLKKHWDSCVTKEHDLDLEYMTRVEQYDYIVPRKNPIRKVAVLPPPSTGKFALKSLGYFEKDVLFNIKEMEEEYLMIPKRWIVNKSFNESYRILRKANIYDKYQAWVEEFIAYRVIDKDLFSKMADILNADTFLIFIIGYDRPGVATAQLKSEAYYEVRFRLLNAYLITAKKGEIVWEYGCELQGSEQYRMTRWRGLYRKIFETMPIE